MTEAKTERPEIPWATFTGIIVRQDVWWEILGRRRDALPVKLDTAVSLDEALEKAWRLRVERRLFTTLETANFKAGLLGLDIR